MYQIVIVCNCNYKTYLKPLNFITDDLNFALNGNISLCTPQDKNISKHIKKNITNDNQSLNITVMRRNNGLPLTESIVDYLLDLVFW